MYALNDAEGGIEPRKAAIIKIDASTLLVVSLLGAKLDAREPSPCGRVTYFVGTGKRTGSLCRRSVHVLTFERLNHGVMPFVVFERRPNACHKPPRWLEDAPDFGEPTHAIRKELQTLQAKTKIECGGIERHLEGARAMPLDWSTRFLSRFACNFYDARVNIEAHDFSGQPNATCGNSCPYTCAACYVEDVFSGLRGSEPLAERAACEFDEYTGAPIQSFTIALR